MNIAYSRMKKHFRRFNKLAFTWEDVLKICARYRINIVFIPMHENIRGYYATTLKTKYRKKYIVLNDKLSGFERLFVALHELIHHFLHVTQEKNHQTFYCRATELIESKEEVEAYSLALMMLVPKSRLLEMCEEVFEDIDPFQADLFIQRKWLYLKYKDMENK